MTDAWDGRPQNPERDGWHWVQRRDLDWPTAVEWSARPYDPEPWGMGAEWWTVALVRQNCTYLGPCLTPAEVEARVAAARREGIEAAAKAAKALTHAWRNPQQRHGVAFGEAITGTIRALLKEGER